MAAVVVLVVIAIKNNKSIEVGSCGSGDDDSE